MREVLDAVLEWIPGWEGDPENSYRGMSAIVNVGALQGGFGWRVSRTPHRTDLFLDVRVPPTKEMAVARRQVLDLVRDLQQRFPEYGVEGEVYVTAPGAEIDEGHALVAAIDAGHEAVFGAPPERDVTRWFSDASALTRYGVPTVNYGTSTGPARHREGREPRHRRAGPDGAGLRACRGAGLRGRVSVYSLPPDLPAPVDDGACDHLAGLAVPELTLDSSQGPVDLAELGSGSRRPLRLPAHRSPEP